MNRVVDDIELAAYEPDSGYGDGAAVATDFLSRARDLGVAYSPRTRATSLLVDGGHTRDVVKADTENSLRLLRPGGRLIITIFAFLGRKTAFAKLEAAGFMPTIVASEVQSFPRIGFERLDHIRSFDVEASVPAGIPATVERLVIQGTAPE